MTSTPDTAAVNSRISAISDTLIERVTAHLSQVGTLARSVLWTGKGSIVVHFTEPMNVTADDKRFAPLTVNWSGTFRATDGAIYLNVPAAWRKADREAGEGEGDTMPMISGLTEPQRKVVDAIHNGNMWVKASQGTLKALSDDGWIIGVHEGGKLCPPFTLSPSGQTLYVDLDMMKNRATDFKVGQSVEYLKWLFNGRQKSFEWVDATVQGVGKGMIFLRYADGTEGQRRATSIRVKPAPILNPTAPIPANEIENLDEPHDDIGTLVSDEAPLTLPDQVIVEVGQPDPYAHFAVGDRAIRKADNAEIVVESVDGDYISGSGTRYCEKAVGMIRSGDGTYIKAKGYAHVPVTVKRAHRKHFLRSMNTAPLPKPDFPAAVDAAALTLGLSSASFQDPEPSPELDPDAFYVEQQREAWRNEDANADADEAQRFWEENEFEASPIPEPEQSADSIYQDYIGTLLRVNDWVQTPAGLKGAIVGFKQDRVAVVALMSEFKSFDTSTDIHDYLAHTLRKIDPPEPTPDPVNDANAYAGTADAALVALEQADIDRAEKADDEANSRAFELAEQNAYKVGQWVYAKGDKGRIDQRLIYADKIDYGIEFFDESGKSYGYDTYDHADVTPIDENPEPEKPADPYAWATPSMRGALDALLARKHVYPQICEPSTTPNVWRIEDEWTVKTMQRTIDKIGGELVGRLEQDWNGDEPYCVALFRLEVDGRADYEPFPSKRPSKPAADPNSIHAQYDALHDTLPAATQLLIQVNGDEWLAFQMDAMLLRRYAPLCRFTVQTINQAGEQWDKLVVPAGVLDELVTLATKGGLTIALASIVRDEPNTLPVREVTEIHRPGEPVQYLGKEEPPTEWETEADEEAQPEAAPIVEAVTPSVAPSKLAMTPELNAAKIRLHIHGGLRLGRLGIVRQLDRHEASGQWFDVFFIHPVRPYIVEALEADYDIESVSGHIVTLRPKTAAPLGDVQAQADAVVNALPDLTPAIDAVNSFAAALSDAQARVDEFVAAKQAVDGPALLDETDERDLIAALKLEHADIDAATFGITHFLLNVIAKMRAVEAARVY